MPIITKYCNVIPLKQQRSTNMTITQEQLAKRLKQERTRLELTQEEVADHLGLKRPTVAQIEAANRTVSSIELVQFAQLYQRRIEDLLSVDEFDESPGLMLLRANADIASETLYEPVRYNLDRCISACEAATKLESLLGIRRSGDVFSYKISRPQTRWEAVEQGMRLADMERKRLNLGSLPARNIVEIISQHGVRVARYTLIDDISGFFFVSPRTGQAILINAGHNATRRLFSYAHEYCHLLADSAQMPSGVSRFATRDDLLEVRANTFAAHFLMPEDGVRSFLDNIGSASRQVMEIYASYKDEYRDDELLTAQRRLPSKSHEIQMVDVLRLARHFGTSYISASYHLLNLKIIQRETLDRLLGEAKQAEQVSTLLLGEAPRLLESEAAADLEQITMGLIVDALLQKKITKPRAQEYMRLLDRNPRDLDELGIAS